MDHTARTPPILRSRPNPDGPGPDVMGADTLIGNSVYNSLGDRLGDIETIMLDVASGRIAYAVLRCGGLLGIGAKLFAIPWSALQLDTFNHSFRLDISAERLAAAPGFDRNHWPSMADPQWARTLHDFYATPPYWHAHDRDAP
jgi:sporulation protein YlmC with PRC-barrel domain